MKTLNIKKITGIIFFIFHFSFFITLKAQIDAGKKAMCNSYMKSTYIFEGKVDSSKYITIKTGQYTYYNYTVYFMEVNKVIKGDIQKGTIEIEQAADGITYKSPDHTESLHSDDGSPPPPNQGLYFCSNKAGKPLHYQNSNAKSLHFYDGESVTNGMIKKWQRGTGLSEYFPTVAEFYAYISENYGIKIEN
ncbi:MAG TPA: hypothetical protein VK809_01020 [Bacteroidia bacterium]|jgi:hypothetical protein|nr:hypothetical protein [Bacteroidia bacterium]